MYFYVIVVLFCSPVLAIPGGRTEITYPSVETLRSGEKILTLRAFGNVIALKLESAGDVVADDFTVTDGDGKIHKTDVKNLKSKLFRNKEKMASLYINEEGPLEIKGLIDSRMKIEPCASNEESKDGRKAHCITRRSEDDKRHGHDTVIPPSISQIYSSDSLMVMQDDQCVVIEYIFVTESTVTERFNNTEAIMEHLSTALLAVQNIMDTLNLRIQVRLINVTAYTKENEPSYIKQSEIAGHEGVLSTNQLLGNMIKYFCEHKDDEDFEKYKRADIIMLMTRKTLGDQPPGGKLFTGISGVAKLGGCCDPCGKCGVIADDVDKMYRDETIAHESAHLIGSPHDGEGPERALPGSPGAKACPGSDGFIMGDESEVNKRKFSNCSRENIKYFLSLPNSQCIIQNCEE
ncbi:venom metalloproteinase antarease-like TpachMP_A [Centruroides vittatus]|uniref:venom metalloproteinase antarease-like TpachMP_A n=1 Tax=Centruroides vittatus TaxID=120091 RepID=UPI00351097B0